MLTGAVTVVAFAPGAPGIDSIGVLRHVRDALAAASVTSGTPTWQDFVGAFDGLVQPLRVVEPGGSPAMGLTVRLAGAAGPVTLDATILETCSRRSGSPGATSPAGRRSTSRTAKRWLPRRREHRSREASFRSRPRRAT